MAPYSTSSFRSLSPSEVKSAALSQQAQPRKFLAVIDGTAECFRAVLYAAHRAQTTQGGLVLLYLLDSAHQSQPWIGVKEMIRADAEQTALEHLDRCISYAREIFSGPLEWYKEEGVGFQSIQNFFQNHSDISILVLAAGSEKAPGPLIRSVADQGLSFSTPVTIIPSNLSDESVRALAQI